MRDTAIGVVILSEAKNPPSLRPFAEFILSEVEGLRVTRRVIFEINSLHSALFRLIAES